MTNVKSIEAALSNAAIQPENWHAALAQVARATGASHAQVIGFKGDAVDFNWVSEIDSGIFAAFGRMQAGSSLHNFRVAAGVTVGSRRIIDERHYDLQKPMLVSDDYLDLCNDWNIPFGCQTEIIADNRSIGIATLRSHREGRTSFKDREIFATMANAIERAVSLQRCLENQGHLLVAGAFEAMRAACFVLDRHLRVRAMTEAARTLIAENAVSLTDDRVSLTDPTDGMALAKVYRDCAVHHGVPSLPIIAAGGLMLRLHRLPVREWGTGFEPFAILTVRRAITLDAEALIVLRTTFGVTRTEAEIAAAIVEGIPRQDIQRRRRISSETLRTHLRSLFAKLGVAREADAVRKLTQLLR